jgi:predicted ATP-dependent endonuclease of OLD family
VIRVVMKNDQTCLISLPPNYWTPEELDKLRQLLDVDSLELFFAKKVLLVEGPTEVGAFPIFSKDTYDFLTHGVSVIGAGGKNNFKVFIKLLKGFEIPFVGVLDKDLKDPRHEEFEQEVKKLVGNPKQVIILSGKFEEIIEKTEPGLLKEAEEEVGKSKPRAGRYIAQKLINKGKIPYEFLEVIHRVEEI